MKGIISTIDPDPESLVRKAKASRGIVGVDLVKEVTCKAPYVWGEERRAGSGEPGAGKGRYEIDHPESSGLRCVVIDYGVKRNILRMLKKVGCHVTVVPADEKAEDILAMEPHGVLLSNGPGDPEGLPYAIEEIRKLIGTIPIFGICLGQQLLGLAFGGKTYKLKFGHRGANQPNRETETGKVYITSENHGFAVDVRSITKEPVRVTHINLNDRTVEGIEHTVYPVFSVQFHPEASPGPHDAYGLFEKFRNMMESYRSTL
jgi:carbamoyl-phosphate synthase small subunit